MAEPRTEANKELIDFTWKSVTVRTPRKGRSRSIVVFSKPIMKPGNFPIVVLNTFNKKLKRQRDPISLCSQLESIDEDDEYTNEEQKKEPENDEHISVPRMRVSRSFDKI